VLEQAMWFQKPPATSWCIPLVAVAAEKKQNGQ